MPDALHPPPVEVLAPAGSPVPLVLDSPHSGRHYPGDFGAALPRAVLRRLEDAYVDHLWAGAPRRGATLVLAGFARSYIDPNRHEADLDTAMLDGPWPAAVRHWSRGADWQRLVWGRVYGAGDIYDRRLGVEEVQRRLRDWHRPFHRALAQVLADAEARHGGVVHLDCHSMPSTGQQGEPDEGAPRPDFILGDRDGTTCAPWLTDLVQAELEALGYTVARNRYYKGGEIVRRYGRPGACDSLQVEVNRRLYLDEEAVAPTAGFASLQAALDGLVTALVRAMGRLG